MCHMLKEILLISLFLCVLQLEFGVMWIFQVTAQGIILTNVYSKRSLAVTTFWKMSA